MIEIKQSRKLHESGYRLMEIKDGKTCKTTNAGADVLHIGFGNWLDGFHLDITKQGIIRIWSEKFELIPQEQFCFSDCVFMAKRKINNDKQL